MFKNFDENGQIKGVGIDLCDITRFDKMRSEIREKLAAKILTDEEFFEYLNAKNKSKTLAVFFCAKESAAKALGIGFNGISFRDIMLQKNTLGKPMIFLSKKAGDIAEKNEIKSIKISITHEDKFVVCFAVAD